MSFMVRSAQRQDNQGILDLLARTSMPGKVALAFERAPDYFNGAHIACQRPDVYVLTPTESEQNTQDPPHEGVEILGVFNIGSRDLYVDGKPRSVYYVHDLRLDRSVRGGKALMACYAKARPIIKDDDMSTTMLLAENIPVLRLLSKKKKGLPNIFHTADVETSLVSGFNKSALGSSGLNIRRATLEDVPIMQAYLQQEGPKRQFFPCYNLNDMLAGDPYYLGQRIEDYWLAFDGDELKGLMGAWDQRGFRQTRVVSYSRTIELFRPFYNLWCVFSGAMRLPPAGQCFDYLMVHCVLIKDNDPLVFRDLLAHLQQCYRQDYHALVCGLCDRDPLFKAMQGFTRRKLHSYQFLGTWVERDPRQDIDPSLIPYADVARL
ncbi:MAG: hypothetical protein EA349_09560 [Halomonadaceae bacterium]|nr:MAG: hypothetical protein EA349_09560 [Halomonadaceae bacterium]